LVTQYEDKQSKK